MGPELTGNAILEGENLIEEIDPQMTQMDADEGKSRSPKSLQLRPI